MTLLQDIQRENGPGSQLWKLLKKLGIRDNPNCSCMMVATLMNELGPEGCRTNRDRLLFLIKKNQESYGWSSYFKAGTLAIFKGQFYINPFDPVSSLFDKAVRLAEEQQQCQKSHGLAV